MELLRCWAAYVLFRDVSAKPLSCCRHPYNSVKGLLNRHTSYVDQCKFFGKICRQSATHKYGPRPLKSTGRLGHFLNSTCDIELIDMRQGHFLKLTWRQGHFLNLTCNMGINKQQRHATLAFLKIDTRHGDPPSRAPQMDINAVLADDQSFVLPFK